MQVYKGKYRGVQDVAVKVVDSPDPKAQARFVIEIATLRALRDPHIVMFLAAGVQEGRTLLLMQFMEHGNLWDALRRDTGSSFGWHGRWVSIWSNAFSSSNSLLMHAGLPGAEHPILHLLSLDLGPAHPVLYLGMIASRAYTAGILTSGHGLCCPMSVVACSGRASAHPQSNA